MDQPPAEPDMVLQRLAERVRAELRPENQLHEAWSEDRRLILDRLLPFLCVYRRPAGKSDPGTARLMLGEAAFLITGSERDQQADLATLVEAIAQRSVEEFGAFLILEIWSAEGDALETDEESGELLPQRPTFKIVTRPKAGPRETVEALGQALRKIRLSRQAAHVEVVQRKGPTPPKLPMLLPPAEVKRLGCFFLGLEVRPVYRDGETRKLYPAVLRTLRRGMSRALKQAFFSFTEAHTNIRARHFHSLGPRALLKPVWDVDRRLAEIDESFDLLWQATPINTEVAWREFRRRGFDQPPVFHYRPAAVEPALIKRRLFDIPLERVEDPTLAHLFREKQDELDRKITMLADIGSPRFLAGSMQVYGTVQDELLSVAQELLRRLTPASRKEKESTRVGAQQFARQATGEIEFYREQYPEFTSEAVIRDDMYSGLMVSQGKLLIGRRTTLTAGRVDPLLHHEVGTHLLTYFNGQAQPFRLLEAGLAGYDGLQEGLAVLSEYLVGGLSRARMRLLAARVVAVKMLLDGATFAETYQVLQHTYAFTPRLAYTITMRVFRGGGLTKDLVYLRGLMEILTHLGSGGKLQPLLIGKIAAEHLPLMNELRHRHVLRDPPLRPRYLDEPHVADRLERLAGGLSVLDLFEEPQ